MHFRSGRRFLLALVVLATNVLGCTSRIPMVVDVVDATTKAPLDRASVTVAVEPFELFAPRGSRGATGPNGRFTTRVPQRNLFVIVTRPHYRINPTSHLIWRNDQYVLGGAVRGEGSDGVHLEHTRSELRVRIELVPKDEPDATVMLSTPFRGLLLVQRDSQPAELSRWDSIRIAQRINARVFRVGSKGEIVLVDPNARMLNGLSDALLLQQSDAEELWYVGDLDRARQLAAALQALPGSATEGQDRQDIYRRVRESLLQGGTALGVLGFAPNPTGE